MKKKDLFLSLTLISLFSLSLLADKREDVEKILISRNIRYSLLTNADKIFFERIKFTKQSNTSDIDMKSICEQITIEKFYLQETKLGDAFYDSILDCNWSNLKDLGIWNTDFKIDIACSILELSDEKKKSLQLVNVKISDQLEYCNRKKINLSSLLIDNPVDFNGKQFCESLNGFKILTNLTIINTSLEKGDLFCILNLPNLEYLSLGRVNKVSATDLLNLISEYRLKYRHKGRLKAEVDMRTVD
ncbi:hypothetical protein [Leptospira bouyouniensis]|uniref:Leucine-rich repeat domain-containing protein n=1 Tax=Leptospira bouyouniensis TaxID=2484911 RepID=A0ABY2LCT6_9LEPT|nr:hypothetical protein [Leptospira bouyouniensis]TGK54176.1 hypothetical protein EHQ10_00420 [Leptospira bouyouniensis]